MSIKLLCTDIDGTLLNKDRALSQKTIRVIESLRDSIKVILASSRMPKAMRHLQEELGITNMPLVCYNGAYVINGDGKVVVSEYIATEVLDNLLKMDVDSQCNISLYSEDNWYTERRDKWTQREIRNTKANPTYGTLATTVDSLKKKQKSAHKIMCMGEENLIDKIEEELQPHSAILNLYRSKETYLEISSKTTNKATGLEKLLLSYSPSIDWSEVISFGDNFNDIDLLKASGIGVAVANAKREVIEVSDIQTESNFENGVAQELVRQCAIKL